MDQESSIFLTGKKICVTGGGGFLGRHVVSALERRGCDRIVVARHEDYDLTSQQDVERLYKDVEPDVVIHLAARVGGIEANRLNPGRFFYDNLMMGVHMIEGARSHNVSKFVQVGTV